MLPAPNDPRWSRILQTDKELPQASLATRILLTRLRGDVRSSPGALAAKIAELRAYFEKNTFAQKDIALF
ncbi:hypothetical protein [Tropicibacter naphthalenivorans]|uniref:Uncharacterized protein n=1 Tax=Tropicibacter naphthalenivorans TaxID=441103 RepID=A0A0P1GXP6_9RHOB|nr:hypothetical protein [Tropicibacter naphthalenivorans]CUH79095.1 hypothetical protein TRN7648_02330 [Tropicibacter naphthalenivorans]SMD03494.1 hypothetical protein SAMN04488093_11144 [Tropicibacter naphthalenivorans]